MKELEGMPQEFIDWYKKRPKVIKEIILKLPPNKLYKIKSTGHQCEIYSYMDPNKVKNCGDKEFIPEATVKVIKTGVREFPN